MQVSVESPSKIERRLTITVPAQELESAFDKRITRIAQTAEIKGFRPGKAPLSHIKQRFGGEARNEALGEVIQNSLYQALKKENLNPINTPQVEPKVIEPNKPLEFVAVFEILPEIEAINFKVDQVEKLKVEIKDSDIDEALERLQSQRVSWRKTDSAAKDKDQVTVDYYAIHDGKPDLEHQVKDFAIVLGSKRMIPGFEEGLMGLKAGDEKMLHLSFPADFMIKEKAGEKVDFSVQVKQVSEPEFPPMDDAFIKSLGIASGKVEDLRNEIKVNLEREKDRRVLDRLKEQLFNKLLEQNPIDVPASLVANEAKRIHDEVHPHHGHEHNHTEEEMSIFNDAAKKRVALSLLIAEYAKKNSIKVDDGRVNARIEEIAASYERPQEVIQWFKSNKEQKAGVESQVLEEQIIDQLIKDASVVEKAVSYQEVIAK